MVNTKKNYSNISVLKIIACFMITVLHIIGNDGTYLQIFVYLVGSYGIPLFFLVNGFLLYDRNFTFEYYKNKIIKCIRFFLLWTISIGLAKSIILKSPVQIIYVVSGAILAKDSLYHLWFLITLMLIYTAVFLIQKYLTGRNKTIQDIISTKTMLIIVLLMNIIFLYSIVAGIAGLPEIRNILPVPFRLITFGGYYYLGMYIHKYNDKIINKFNPTVSLLVAVISFICICAVSKFSGIIWASSYYSCLFVIIGCISLYCLITQLKYFDKHTKIINNLSITTTGIWIIHPFANKAFIKMLSYTGIEYNFYIRFISLLIILISCYIAVKFMIKLKYIRKYVTF